jgi:hypothetical protein
MGTQNSNYSAPLDRIQKVEMKMGFKIESPQKNSRRIIETSKVGGDQKLARTNATGHPKQGTLCA